MKREGAKWLAAVDVNSQGAGCNVTFCLIGYDRGRYPKPWLKGRKKIDIEVEPSR